MLLSITFFDPYKTDSAFVCNSDLSKKKKKLTIYLVKNPSISRYGSPF